VRCRDAAAAEREPRGERVVWCAAPTPASLDDEHTDGSGGAPIRRDPISTERPMKIRKLAGALLLAVAAAGCDNPFDSDQFQREELARARALWSREGGPSYTFTLELQCYCASGTSLAPVMVTVKNGQPVSRIYKKANAADPSINASAEVFGPYDTVDELFEVVEDAIDRDANVLQVGYNDAKGFPEIINVAVKGGTANDQRIVFISGFALTPAS
jgi:hypothetical protein